MTAIAVFGNSEDVPLIRKPLSVGLEEEDTAEGRSRRRDLLRAKLSVPVALGILANRTSSTAPVEALAPLASVVNATETIGPGTALELRFEALKGLAIANTPAARALLDANLTYGLSAGAIPRVDTLRFLESMTVGDPSWWTRTRNAPAAITPDEAAKIRGVERDVRELGIEQLLARP